MPEQDCPRGAQPPLGLQLREPRIRAQGLLGRGVAQDPAFSSNAQSDPSLPTPTCDLLLFILMFTGQYIRLDRNSKAYTMTSPPSPSATSNRIRFPCTFPGMFLAYLHVFIYAGFLFGRTVLQFAFSIYQYREIPSWFFVQPYSIPKPRPHLFQMTLCRLWLTGRTGSFPAPSTMQRAEQGDPEPAVSSLGFPILSMDLTQDPKARSGTRPLRSP